MEDARASAGHCLHAIQILDPLSFARESDSSSIRLWTLVELRARIHDAAAVENACPKQASVSKKAFFSSAPMTRIPACSQGSSSRMPSGSAAITKASPSPSARATRSQRCDASLSSACTSNSGASAASALPFDARPHTGALLSGAARRRSTAFSGSAGCTQNQRMMASGLVWCKEWDVTAKVRSSTEMRLSKCD